MSQTKRTHPKRVALFVPLLVGGGAERVMLHLARAFSELGQEVDFVVVSVGGELDGQVPSGVNFINLNAGGVLKALPQLMRYLRQRRPSALLSTLDHANIIAISAKYLSGSQTRVVIRITTPISIALPHSRKRTDRWLPRIAKLFYPLADAIIAVSQGVAEDLLTVTCAVRDKVRVIYNPVPIDHIQRQTESAFACSWLTDGGPPTILSVGRLISLKDFDTLIRAVTIVQVQQPVRLLILGEGDQRSHLEQLIQDLGLENMIKLPGFISNPYAYMRRADLFVLSSKWEGFPNVLLEALACGCPVVATDSIGGARELLDNGRYGKLVPVGDAPALAAAILETLDNPNDKDVLVNYIRQYFEYHEIARQYLSVLLPHY